MKQHVIQFLELLKLNTVIVVGTLEMCCAHRVVLHVFLFPEADSYPNMRKIREEGDARWPPLMMLYNGSGTTYS